MSPGDFCALLWLPACRPSFSISRLVLLRRSRSSCARASCSDSLRESSFGACRAAELVGHLVERARHLLRRARLIFAQALGRLAARDPGRADPRCGAHLVGRLLHASGKLLLLELARGVAGGGGARVLVLFLSAGSRNARRLLLQTVLQPLHAFGQPLLLARQTAHGVLIALAGLAEL